MKEIYILGIVALIVLSIVVMPTVNINSTGTGQGLDYHSEVCIYKNNELIQCSPNTLTDAGKNHIKELLGVFGASEGGSANVSFIAVANNTPSGNHAVADTSLDNETTCCGLERALGSYSSIGTGNWSITKTFIATAAVNEVNATGLYNASSSGTYFAYNTFQAVDLAADDQINVTWTIWVT